MMICCLNPDCQKPLNPDTHKHCQQCGTPLIALLRNRFKIIKPLGRGGFGKTYLAEDADKLNDRCVVKQLIYQAQGTQASRKIVELFMREAEQLKALKQNQQIPDLLAYFEDNGYLYLVQEYVEGQDLSKALAQTGTFSDVQIKALLSDVLPVLQFIHERGVIHRDLKPENIMRRQRDGKLVLIDFGVAKEISVSQLKLTGTKVGSPGYSSLEQFRDGKAVPASDLYSLGATCFHLLTGQYPGDLWTTQGYGWVRTWHQYLPRAISPELTQVIDIMLQVDLEQRYQTAAGVLEDLKAPLTPVLDVRQNRRRFLSLLTFGGVGVVSVLVWEAIRQHVLLQSFTFEVVSVNFQGQISDRRQEQAQFFTKDLGSGVTLDMVLIPGGRFEMGSSDSEIKRDDDEGPQHQVTVKPFFMAKYEVTQAQWREVALLPQVDRELEPDPSKFKRPNRPVEGVSWQQAIEFCARLSQKVGREYRLPSEAEWEYACRAGTTTPFYFGETIAPKIVNYDGNYRYGFGPKGEYRQQTTNVGSFFPNAFGLYDMHGNVWEWCLDHWHENYQGASIDGSVWVVGGDDRYRVMRGGSWYSDPGHCSSANRSKKELDSGSSSLGFRVVCSASRTLWPKTMKAAIWGNL